MNKLKSIYNPSLERGGLFELTASDGKLTCIEFHQVNGTNNSTSYNPNTVLWNEKVQQILGRGNLPLAVHTHPTKIGLHAYDSKQVRFYLKSSRPDRLIADKTISENLQMPEAIFVKDERFGTGYGLALYEGGLFPYAISAVSDTQLVILIGTGLLMAFNKLSRKVLYLLIGWFLFEFLRRPKYEYDGGGNLEIKISF
ncbi:hypothetical protein [Emticicia fontis]